MRSHSRLSQSGVERLGLRRSRWLPKSTVPEFENSTTLPPDDLLVTQAFPPVKIANSGTTLLTVAGSGGGGIAIDGADNVWVTDITSTAVRGLSNSGSPISGTFGYNAGVLLDPLFLALDGSGDIWVVDQQYGSDSRFACRS
jgi:hypothetical protein